VRSCEKIAERSGRPWSVQKTGGRLRILHSFKTTKPDRLVFLAVTTLGKCTQGRLTTHAVLMKCVYCVGETAIVGGKKSIRHQVARLITPGGAAPRSALVAALQYLDWAVPRPCANTSRRYSSIHANFRIPHFLRWGCTPDGHPRALPGHAIDQNSLVWCRDPK